jgi:hypothetical protein
MPMVMRRGPVVDGEVAVVEQPLELGLHQPWGGADAAAAASLDSTPGKDSSASTALHVP